VPLRWDAEWVRPTFSYRSVAAIRHLSSYQPDKHGAAGAAITLALSHSQASSQSKNAPVVTADFHYRVQCLKSFAKLWICGPISRVNCCCPSPAQSFLVPRLTGPTTVFFSLTNLSHHLSSRAGTAGHLVADVTKWTLVSPRPTWEERLSFGRTSLQFYVRWLRLAVWGPDW
jgi:hypothetical protein